MITISYLGYSFWNLWYLPAVLLRHLCQVDAFRKGKRREILYLGGKKTLIHNPDVIISGLSGKNPVVESQLHVKLGQKILFDHKTCFKIQQSPRRSDITWITGILNTEMYAEISIL